MHITLDYDSMIVDFKNNRYNCFIVQLLSDLNVTFLLIEK